MKNPDLCYIAYPQNTIRLLQKYEFQFRKQFGQNFLIDLHVLDKIVRASELSADDVCIEVGPGIGSLTQVLAESAGKVLAVEIDKRLIPILRDNLLAYPNVSVIEGDFMNLDLPAFLHEQGADEFLNRGGKLRVVANLPYYITTPLIMMLLESDIPLSSITVMVQEEVAKRMQAGPGGKEYGALSLAVQYHAKAEIAAYVPQNCFMPRPGVGSAVVHLTVLSEPAVCVRDSQRLFSLIKAAFGQRRKTLANALSGSPELNLSKEEAQNLIEKAGFDPMIRGEVLTLDDFARLEKAL